MHYALCLFLCSSLECLLLAPSFLLTKEPLIFFKTMSPFTSFRKPCLHFNSFVVIFIKCLLDALRVLIHLIFFSQSLWANSFSHVMGEEISVLCL